MTGRKKNRYNREILLSLYAGIPFLFIAMLVRYLKEPDNPAGNIILILGGTCFLSIAFAVTFLFRISNRRWLIAYGVVLLSLQTAAAVLLGVFVHEDFFLLVFNLNINIQLAIGLYLVDRLLTRLSFQQNSRSISVTVLLLISVLSLSHIFHLHHVFSDPAGVLVADLLFELFDAAIFVPVLVSLVSLKRKSEKVLRISAAGVFFQGRSIADVFSDFQRKTLARLATRGPVICGEIALENCAPRGPGCKPSACTAYSSIYRKMNNLRKTIEALGIGSIVAPLNKQDIRKEGWRLRLYSGVRLKADRTPSEPFMESENVVKACPPGGSEPGEEKPGLHHTERILGLVFAVFTAIAFAAEFILLIPVSIDNAFRFIIVAGIGAAVFAGVFIPFLAPEWKRCFIEISVFFGIVELGILASSLFLGDIAAFFLFIKVLAITALVFLYNFRRFDRQIPMPRLRAAVGRGIFWVVWFYLAALIVLRNPAVTPKMAATFESVLGAVFLFYERVLIVFVMISMFLFFMHRRKLFSIQSEGFSLNGRILEQGLTIPNADLLRLFLSSDEGVLVCKTIVRANFPEEFGYCEKGCKPSLCGAYQRIYKRIREIRKFLETYGLGTIVSPDRNADVKTDGWELYFFDDVYVKKNVPSVGGT